MKIDSKDKEVKKVLETGYYYVPRFQRPYSWEKDQINDFWNDSLVESETDYFIGSIVVYKMDDETYGIVDGQQRLTTITMLLCAIRNAYDDEGFKDLAKGIHTQIEREDLRYKKKFVLQTETSYPYLQEYIQKFGSPDVEPEYGQEEVNLKNAFDLICLNVEDVIAPIRANRQLDPDKQKKAILKKLDELRDRILKLKVIYIELDNEDDAYIIFETLNTRGKDLAVSDLVKNYLTKLVKSDNERVDIPKDKWNKVRDAIENSGSDLTIDNFLLHQWLSKYEYTSSKKLFKRLKSTIKKHNAKDFLEELLIDSETYKIVFAPDTKAWKKEEIDMKLSLKALNTFKVTQQTPIVLSILREYFNGTIRLKVAKDALRAIEHFHYIFTAITSQRSSGGISSMYSLSARNLFEANDPREKINAIHELKTKMIARLPSFEEFLASFQTLAFLNSYPKDKKIIQYTLSKIDREMNKSGASINYDLMSIEHLIPQSSKDKSASKLTTIGQIGNLLLVSEELNNKLGIKDFSKKQLLLKSSAVYFDSVLAKAAVWDSESIGERTKHLAELCYKRIFKI